MDCDFVLKIFGVCVLVNVDGLRGDIVVIRVVKVFVVFEGCIEVMMEDIVCVIGFCLSYWLRKDVIDIMDGGFKVTFAFNKIFKGSVMFNFDEIMVEGIKVLELEKLKEVVKLKEELKKKVGVWFGLFGGCWEI